MWNSILGSELKLGSSNILESKRFATWDISPGECINGIWFEILIGLLSISGILYCLFVEDIKLERVYCKFYS
jgi:hypothetical protein